MSPPLSNLGGPPMYCPPPPHFYHKMCFDWLVPPTYKIVPAPLVIYNTLYIYIYIYVYIYVYDRMNLSSEIAHLNTLHVYIRAYAYTYVHIYVDAYIY